MTLSLVEELKISIVIVSPELTILTLIKFV